jgi:hypothetical protein
MKIVHFASGTQRDKDSLVKEINELTVLLKNSEYDCSSNFSINYRQEIKKKLMNMKKKSKI